MKRLLGLVVVLLSLWLLSCSSADALDVLYVKDLTANSLEYGEGYQQVLAVTATSMGTLGIPSDPMAGNVQSGLVYFFSDELWVDERLLYFTVQLPPGYAEGTDVTVRVHFLYRIDEVGTFVRWRLSSSWANIGEPFGVALNCWALSGPTNNDGANHMLTAFPVVSGVGKKVGSLLSCYISRNSSNALDTYTDVAQLEGVDVLYQVNSPGEEL